MLKKALLLAALTLSLATMIGAAAPDMPTPDCYPCAVPPAK